MTRFVREHPLFHLVMFFLLAVLTYRQCAASPPTLPRRCQQRRRWPAPSLTTGTGLAPHCRPGLRRGPAERGRLRPPLTPAERRRCWGSTTRTNRRCRARTVDSVSRWPRRDVDRENPVARSMLCNHWCSASAPRSADGRSSSASAGASAPSRTVARDRTVSDDLHQEALRILLGRSAPAVSAIPRNPRLRQLPHPDPGHSPLPGRTQGRRRPYARLALLEDDKPDAAELVARAEQIRLVRQVVEELSVDRDRDLLRRYYLGQESKERIQADHGLTSLQFNRVLHRARKRFQELWEERQLPRSKHL